MAMKTHSRRDFIRTMGTGTLAAITFPLRPRIANSAGDERPNILYIMSDDHAANAVSCYGSELSRYAPTPNIDRIAGEGMRVDNCFCTNSICAPSRAVILTGQYSHLNGLSTNFESFDCSQRTFPKLLRQAGYQTAMIGKWHLRCEPTGFDYWNVLPGQGAYHDPDMIEMGTKTKHSGYVTDIITDQSMEWLDRRDSTKPFLLMCQHKAPHMPWESDDKHADMFDDVTFPEPPTFNDDYDTRTPALTYHEQTIEDHLNYWMKWDVPDGLEGPERKSWLYQQYMKVYLRSIASVDDNIGRILDYLDRTGLAENTIVVYTSDQGFFLGEHGIFDKRFMYEEALRMPLVVRYPRGIRPGSVSTDMVLNLDFAPTFLDFAGVSVPGDMQGKSAKPIFGGVSPDDWRESFYYRYSEEWLAPPHCGLRTERYKLMHFYSIQAELQWELYDLENDPYETMNLYNNPDYASIRESLKRELERQRNAVGDTEF
jgi:arylsulfatase A-like enzyme